MEAMVSQLAHEPVGFGGAVAHQFRLLWTTRRPLLLLVGTAGLLALAGEPIGTEELARLLATWPVLVAVIGPIWALAVFNHEGPSRRLYHWSQPVRRDVHTMARVVAGAGWLVAVYAVLVLLAVTFGAIDGNGWQLGALPAASWVNLFTGPLIGYLAVSVLAVTSDYPFRWLIAILFLIPLVGGLVLGWLNLGFMTEALVQPVANERWGLAFAILGGFTPAATQIVSQALAGGPASAIAIPTSWWLVTVMWMVGLGGLVAFLATRHPDRMPRLPWRR